MSKIVAVIFLGFLIIFASLPVNGQNKVDSNFHVYLLIGQSNMAGRGKVDQISKDENPRILMLNKADEWVEATDPVHFDKQEAGVGPGISFATEMLGKNKKVKIGLIPCALGGSPIKVWKPGSTYLKVFHPYEDAVSRTRLAMQTGVLKGILWHQGESDNDSARAAVYIDKLKTLIASLRNEFQQPNIPFIAGEIGYFNKADYINPVINQLPALVSCTAVVSSKDLTDKGDHLHFDTSSARQLGRRYAEAMKKVQSASGRADNRKRPKL